MAQSAENSTGWRRVPALWALAAVILFFAASPAAHANSTIFYNNYGTGSNPCIPYPYCYQSGQFGLLVGLGASGITTGGELVIANNAATHIVGEPGTDGGSIGIGTGDFTNTASGKAETWTGPVDFADPSHNGGLPTGDNLTNITLTHPYTTSDTIVGTALNQAYSISQYFNSQSATGTAPSVLTGGTSNQTLTLSTGLTVLDVSSISMSHILTISGNANDVLVINDSGSANFKSGAKIVLTGGLSADNVLFNITSSSGTVLSINSGNLLQSDFIIRGQASLANATLDGRILGGTTITLGNNWYQEVPEDIPETPEPSSWLLFSCGLGAALYLGRRLRQPAFAGFAGRFRETMKSDAEGPVGYLPPSSGAAARGNGGDGPPLTCAGLPPPGDGGGGGSGGVGRPDLG